MSAEKKVWILYVNDGDAECGDPSDSNIFECEASGKRHALRTMLDFWKGHDAVLYEYVEHGKNLESERMVGLLSEGVEVLMGRCA